MPGLVNAHTHVYMTLFRNCADDLTFNDWLFGRILPLEDALTPEDCYWGTLLGILEMLAARYRRPFQHNGLSSWTPPPRAAR